LPRCDVGRPGLYQLLLRSQGPRGPTAIDCPVTTPNQLPFSLVCSSEAILVRRLGLGFRFFNWLIRA
jgi:hypothetical protein